MIEPGAARAVVALLLGMAAPALLAAPPAAGSSALQRPALPALAPERAVLLAAARAGQRIVAVGERGIVVLSDDEGVHWRQAAGVPTSVTLTALRFADDRNGWAVGHGGVILHSGDGGLTWRMQADGRSLAAAALQFARQHPSAQQLKAAQQLVDDGPDKPLLDVWFVDARHGFVVGAYNLFFETVDGGRTWASAMDRLDNPKSLHLYGVRSQGDAVYIVGEQGLIQRSLDGGRTFTALGSPYAGSWFSLALAGDGKLVAAGLRGNAYISRNQGQSWSRIEGGAPVSFVSAVPLGDEQVLLVNQAGQLLTSRGGSPLTPLRIPPQPPLADVLPLKDGALLTLGMAGAARLPAPGATP